MKRTPRTHRLFALLLAVVMLVTMMPVNAFANGATISGSVTTVKVGSGASGRENDFNKGWKFNLGDNSSASDAGFNDSGWEDVDLPHDFSITQTFTGDGTAEGESGFLPGGTGWYRKSFTLDHSDAGKTFLLNFDGVYMHATVYVNGTLVGEHHYGYTAFAFDISRYLTCDGATENVIAVKVVNELPTSRWYSGSGIYRDVTLFVLDPVHVDLNGVTVTTPNLADNDGTVNMKTELVNDSDSAVTATVTNTIYKKEDMTSVGSVTTSVSVPANGSATANTSCVPGNYELWSLEDPNLYIVETVVSVNGQTVDTSETTFGFRWFTFSSTGFALNGRNVKLNGVCMHHDQGGLGSAAYYDAIYRQMSIMKDMGANAIRTAHNPADEQLIEICNELGLLVVEEAFDGLNIAKNYNYNDFSTHFQAAADAALLGYASGMTCAEYAARSMVERDKNAPSVIAWSFGNEIQEGASTSSDFITICQNFISRVQSIDTTRPVTIGDNTRGGNSTLVSVIQKILDANGIAGYNYANSVSTLSSLASSYGGNHNCIIASETASHTNSRGIYMSQASNSNGDGKYHVTSYDTSAVSWGITAHDSIYNTYQLDNVAGEFVWTGFDYIGEPTPWNDPYNSSNGAASNYPNSSYFGIVETTGFPKDSYYLYRSQWNKNDTTVHLVTAWDSDNYMLSSGKTPVWLYSNAYKVELYRNGDLIGTAIRTANTTNAGHTYYTYSATSNDTSVCTVSNGSGSSALYAVFNVAYAAGTLSTRAYNADGSEITLTDDMGQHTVTTPGTVSKLAASANKTSVTADGSSLVYVEVDVTDADGSLDTTATNNITFSVSGPATIAAVDNGDQATVDKFQQASVLTSDTTANIDAYAGKALVILRSTEEAGTITLNIASSGLSGQTITINATDAGEDAGDSGLVTYSMIRDYTIKAGTVPALDTAITGTLSNGSTVSGTIEWDPITADTYNNYGDYTIYGTAAFADLEPVTVSARLHVIPNIIDLRNISAAAMVGNTPVLPATVRGVLADGELAGEFAVVWDAPAASEYDTVGEIVTVTGTAVIFGEETMDVTCTVRVAEAVNTESTNIAPEADSLSQDIDSNYQSDNLESIRNGTLKPGDNTNERWTNWDNRQNSAEATLTLTWATAHAISSVNLYYYDDGCSGVPESVEFSYSLNGQEYTVIGHTAEQVETYSLGALYTYTFEEPVSPVGLKVKFTQRSGTSGDHCVGLTEMEVMTYAASMEVSDSADLSAIYAGGTAIAGFTADDLTYEADQDAITADTAVNAGITVLPAYEGVVRILTVSEDGTADKTYEVTVPVEAACEHTTTELRNESAATCTADGYTGDTYCVDCGELVETGTVSAALGHGWSGWTVDTAATCTTAGSQSRSCSRCDASETETIAATGHSWSAWTTVDATCTTAGSKTRTCSACQATESQTIAAKGHTWDSGVVTQEPTADADGVKTFTCTVCGGTRTEAVKYQASLKAPTVSMELTTTSAGKITITGRVDDFENLDEYYEITAHGLLYIKSSRIGTRLLTVNTSGRTKVSFTGYDESGAFSYSFKPTSKSTTYAYRAYITYTNTQTGQTVTVYSDMVRGSYNTLAG